jgi:hypothetical protein
MAGIPAQLRDEIRLTRAVMVPGMEKESGLAEK